VLFDSGVLREKLTRRERIVYQGTADHSVSAREPNIWVPAGEARNLQDTVPRLHAVFAVSDAMKPTHHGTEPIEGP
jgi:hypothetical protein